MSTPPPPPGGDDNPYDYNPQHGDSSNDSSHRDQGYGDASQQGYGQQYGQSQSGYSGGYQSAPNYSGGQAPNTVDNNFGVIALVTGILGLLICQPVGIAAIIYGRKAKAAERAGRANNATLGVVGFWLGIVALVLMVLAIVGVVLFVVLAAGSSSSIGTY